MLVPLAILEISCVVIYLIPATSVFGAILLTGYIGGAICTHWRAGDPFVVQIVLGLLVWLALYPSRGSPEGPHSAKKVLGTVDLAVFGSSSE